MDTKRRLYLLTMCWSLLGCAQNTSVPRPTSDSAAGRQEASSAASYRLEEQELDTPWGSMRTWLYLPEGNVAQPIRCVVVPPAGGNLITGMMLSEDDRAEHLPYVHAGYAVLSFDIAGALADDADDEDFLVGIEHFRKAKAGVENARMALSEVLAGHPELDGNSVFAAGHSSAGTLALLLAAVEPRIKAVAAYAPVTDVPARLAEQSVSLDQAFPGYLAFLRDSSPDRHADRLAVKPVFLFHASDDSVVSPSETLHLLELMSGHHTSSQRKVVANGDHYHAMIRQGIPLAIAWFDGLGI